MNRTFVQLARDFDPDKHTIGGSYLSIKLDGQRALWDGGITTGVPKKDVPWANTTKDERYKCSIVASGLWSRYGNVIHAPGWFIDALPKGIMLDGELYLGRGKFQEGRSITSTLVPDETLWRQIRYKVFDMPSPNAFFDSGQINDPNCSLYIDEEECRGFYRLKMNSLRFEQMQNQVLTFEKTVARMHGLASSCNDCWQFVNQVKLPFMEKEAREIIDKFLEDETNRGGEGLMLRIWNSIWVPKRVQHILKVKKFLDDEGTVVGYQAGLGKYQGMLGALVIEWEGKRFNLSGFTDEERMLNEHGVRWATLNAGSIYPGSMNLSNRYKYGDRVRFRYRTLTDDGYPREARFFR